VLLHSGLFWLSSCIKELTEIQSIEKPIRRLDFEQLKKTYSRTSNRVIFLDYDGTLTPLKQFPHLAVPSKRVIEILRKLSENPKNKIYVISGRERKFMESCLGFLRIGFSCEHGCLYRLVSVEGLENNWIDIGQELDVSWRENVKSIFDDYVDRTPGSFVEVKEINLTWHFRNSDPEFGEYQKNELILHLQGLPSLPIDILIGKKCVEVRPQGINKGSAVKMIMSREQTDFVLAIGDDKTDEDMFEELKKMEKKFELFSITVEKKASGAMFYLDSQSAVIELFSKLAEC